MVVKGLSRNVCSLALTCFLTFIFQFVYYCDVLYPPSSYLTYLVQTVYNFIVFFLSFGFQFYVQRYQ